MKPLPLLIAASVAANAALLALVLTRSTAAPSASASATPALRSQPAAPSAPPAVNPRLWTDLAADPADLPGFVARLRAAGFPPTVVRALVVAQIREDYAARRRALHPGRGETPFWKNDQPTDPKTRLALRELNREADAKISELVGAPDLDRNIYLSLLDRRTTGDLPPEKAARLTTIKRDYDEMRSEIYDAFRGGSMLPEDRTKLALLEKEQRADLALVLTPKELEDYDLRTGNTASQMRNNLTAFAPNEAEFRAIYKLQQAFDTQLGAMGPGMPLEQMRARSDAQKLLNDQIKAALGPERGAEYERSTDFAYRQATLVADRLNLPATTAKDLWAAKADFEQRRTSLNTDTSLSAEVRRSQTAALQQEALAKVNTLLTPRGAELYQQNGGFWVQQLQARPTSAPGAGNNTIIYSGGTSTIINGSGPVRIPAGAIPLPTTTPTTTTVTRPPGG
jgi:hypothetical protein